MRTPLENMKLFADRRDRLSKKMAGSVLILAAPPESHYSGVGHSFRQNSNLYYLTGFEEPGSVFVFRPGKSPETILFVREKDKERETWDGFRYGTQGAQSTFRMDKTFSLDKFGEEIVGLLRDSESLYYRPYQDAVMDKEIEKALLGLRASYGRSGYGLLTVQDSDELLGELRIIKSEPEIANLRAACDLSVQAHIEVMKYVRPGQTERELHGYFIYQIMKMGAAREGYGGIFAGGANACTLHYIFNDQKLVKDDLLLVDAAGEYNYFTSDITRTYPISGKFSEAQARVYSGVLKIQKTIIEHVKPGVPFQELHDMGSSMLTDLMLDLGLLTGRKDDIIKAGEHRKYYPHGIGHYLGMNVHDSGLYFNKTTRDPRRIEAGMTFTVEPGLYIPENDSNAPREFRGIGIRIEDNILVTPQGHEVLTRRCPKEIEDLERVVGK